MILSVNKFELLLIGCLSALSWIGNADSISVKNGWLVHGNKAIWGLGEFNGIWTRKEGLRPNLTRNVPGINGPNYTEDLEQLVENMLEYGYPGFEHSYGLWYDGRRDSHDIECRVDDQVVPPFMEQPWARSDQGVACDGLPLYDLTRFNPWYFNRLREFARLADEKGMVFYHNFHLQHDLLEQGAHYVDFPWRPGNSIQDTGMPESLPAANVFYDTSHPERARLHRLYINKVLDELGEYKNVIHFPAAEYTGNFLFVKFWLETIINWKSRHPESEIKLGVAAPKLVLDAVALDPEYSKHVTALDLRYFWYAADGSLHAIKGGIQKPGRIFYGDAIQKRSSPDQVYRQVLEYRLRFPDKVLFHSLGLKNNFMVPMLMGGGSINFAKFAYPGDDHPDRYIEPDLPSYYPGLFGFIKSYVTQDLVDMKPDPEMDRGQSQNKVLSSDTAILIHLHKGEPALLDLTQRAGQYSSVFYSIDSAEVIHNDQPIYGWQINKVVPPDDSEWLVFIKRAEN